MLDRWRNRFNADYQPQRFAALQADLESDLGGEIPFRIAEAPVFLPWSLVRQMDDASRRMIARLLADPRLPGAVAARVPPGAHVPGLDAHPHFLSFDFALARGAEGAVEPRLTEVQGFPSLFAFQAELSRRFLHAYRLEADYLPPGLDAARFEAALRETVLGGRPPEEVALVDVYPDRQGTWPDFELTQRLLPGLAVVHAGDLHRRGQALFRVEGGRPRPVRRIFNRLVWEEYLAHRDEIPVSLHDDLDVEWAGHPGWFYRISKLALPLLDDPLTPRAWFLDEAAGVDLRSTVLKPLFSFSGKGVVLDPTEADVAAIPEAERGRYLLQERFEYAEAVRDPWGGRVRCELRLLYVWTGREPELLILLPRLSRGRLMGCAFNTTEPWTGHGVAFVDPEA
jgi:hypothetical protein